MAWFLLTTIGSCRHLKQATGRNVDIIITTIQDFLLLWIGGGYKVSFLEHSRVIDILWGFHVVNVGWFRSQKLPVM